MTNVLFASKLHIYAVFLNAIKAIIAYIIVQCNWICSFNLFYIIFEIRSFL